MNSNNNTNNLPVIFNYEGKQIRSVKIDGDTWLVAKDICEVLEIADHKSAIRALDEDEIRGCELCTPSNGGYSTVNVINEAGLYKLTFRSRKPKAKEFTRWVTHDVLPEIRRTGCYIDPALKDATYKPKPAPVPADIKIYLSKANFSAQERIINRAIDAKYLVDEHSPDADKECQKVLALDFAFRKRTGYSALEAAGIKIEISTCGLTQSFDNWINIDWISHFSVYFSDTRLDIPAPRSEEHVFDIDA